MEKFYRIGAIVFIHILFALTEAGIIIALYYRELAIALLCAAGKSCVHGMWKSQALMFWWSDSKYD